MPPSLHRAGLVHLYFGGHSQGESHGFVVLWPVSRATRATDTDFLFLVANVNFTVCHVVYQWVYHTGLPHPINGRIIPVYGRFSGDRATMCKQHSVDNHGGYSVEVKNGKTRGQHGCPLYVTLVVRPNAPDTADRLTLRNDGCSNHVH